MVNIPATKNGAYFLYSFAVPDFLGHPHVAWPFPHPRCLNPKSSIARNLSWHTARRSAIAPKSLHRSWQEVTGWLRSIGGKHTFETNNQCWLVVLTILKNMKVNGKDDPIYYGKNVWNHQPEWRVEVSGSVFFLSYVCLCIECHIVPRLWIYASRKIMKHIGLSCSRLS